MVAAQKLKLPSPIPIRLFKNTTNYEEGINFAVAGAGTTYAWAHATLHTQVNQFEAFIKSKNISNNHLYESIAIVNIGFNDYGTYHGELQVCLNFTTNNNNKFMMKSFTSNFRLFLFF